MSPAEEQAEMLAIYGQHAARQQYARYLEFRQREEERKRDFIIRHPKFFPEVLPSGVHLINLHCAQFTFLHLAAQHRVKTLPRVRWCNQPTSTDWLVFEQEGDFCCDGVFDDVDFLGLWQPLLRQIWLRADQHPKTIVHTAAHEFCHFITGSRDEDECCRYANIVSKDVEYDLMPYFSYFDGPKYLACHRCA
jgi:hypothetical protein